MGNTVTKSDCVKLEGHEMINEFYTVKRTSGEMETGWVTGRGVGGPDWVNNAAFKMNSGAWRIYMNNQKDDVNTVVQGWRPLETIYPTRLEGDSDGIKLWRDKIKKYLYDLEDLRILAELEAARKIAEEEDGLMNQTT